MPLVSTLPKIFELSQNLHGIDLAPKFQVSRRSRIRPVRKRTIRKALANRHRLSRWRRGIPATSAATAGFSSPLWSALVIQILAAAYYAYAILLAIDPTAITCTASPYGYAYTGIDLAVKTNSVVGKDFTQSYTVTGVPICDD